MKLKRKIFLIFSLVAVIPMIFLTTYTVVQYTHMIDNRMEVFPMSSRKIYQMLSMLRILPSVRFSCC